MPFGIITTSTIVLAIVSCVIFWKTIANNFRQRKQLILINIIFFIFILLSVIYSENIEVSFNEVRRDINLLVFPLILLLFFPKITTSQLNKVLNSYLCATILLLLIYLGLIVKYGYDNSNTKLFLDYPYRAIIEGKSHMKVTPTYLSLWFSFSVLYVLYRLKSVDNKIKKGLYVFMALSFYLFILLIAARMVFIALNIILVALLFYNNKTTLYKKISAFVVLVLLIGVMGYSFSYTSLFKQRYYNEVFVKKIKIPKGRNPSSLSIRYGIYNCAINLVKSAPVFGHGVGDVQDKLNRCYQSSYRSSFYKKKKFDSHNYYLSLLLSGGIITLLSFVLMVTYNLKIGLNSQDILYVGFMLLILLCCLTESLLNRVYGTVFFAFFNALFLLKNIKTVKS